MGKPNSVAISWFFIEADGMCKLEDIDSLLRDMWLECCGHLSCFSINNQRYEFGQIPGSVVGAWELG